MVRISTKKVVAIILLNTFMRLYFSRLKGLFLFSIGVHLHTRKKDNPARRGHTNGDVTCDIAHRENNHKEVEITKQRKCVFAWNPPAVLLRAIKEI